MDARRVVGVGRGVGSVVQFSLGAALIYVTGIKVQPPNLLGIFLGLVLMGWTPSKIVDVLAAILEVRRRLEDTGSGPGQSGPAPHGDSSVPPG